MRQLSLKTLLLFAVIIFSASCKRERDEVNPESSSLEKTASLASITSFDYVITASQSVVDASSLNLKEGAVIGIEGGSRGPLLIRNLHGSPTAPITIVNKGSKSVIKSSGSYGMKVENSKYIRITGVGVTGTEYGLEIDGGHIGISMDNLTTNFEIDHMQIHNIGFAGIMAKTDPSCNEATWRENFTMRDIKIHHNYVHHCGGEGLYIGNSFYASGRSLSCGSVLPHAIEGARIYKNKVAYTDAEGIQVGCVITDCEIYDNTVENFGQDPFANYQNNGIQIGEGTGGKLYNNVIKNGPGNGIVMLGLGDNVAYNNMVINAGENGVFCDERYTPEKGFTFVNNTIINPGVDGFRVYSEKVPENTIINNIVIKPGSGKFISTSNSPRIKESNNYFNNDINTVKFANAAGGDFRLSSSSPCIDKGANSGAFGVTTDCHYGTRPSGTAYDIGAHEFGGTPTTQPDGGTTIPTEPDPTTDPVTSGQITVSDDAYLQSGILYNNQDLRIEPGKRVSYLKFNLASPVSSAKLRLSVGNDNGGGTIRVFKGSHNNWTQTTLSSSTAPTIGAQLGTLRNTFALGSSYDIDVSSGVAAAGVYTFIVVMDAGGNDVSFSSKEGAAAPVLITTASSGGGTTTPPTTTDPTTPTTDPTSPTTSAAVTSITLIDASKNANIMTIQNGATVNLATVGTSSFNIRANTTTSTASVRFGYNGNQNYRTESYAPFALFGDKYPSYNGAPLALGTHTVSVTPYSGTAASGTSGTTYTVTFTVVSGTTTVANTAPVISPVADVQMTEGQTSTVNVVAKDAQNDAVAITASGLPAFAALKDNGNGTAAVTITPGSSHAGTYTVTVTATDAKGAKSSYAFKIVVQDVVSSTTAKFLTIADAYLQSGKGYNVSDLRIENNRREMLIRFEVTGLGTTLPKTAKLRLKVSADQGYGPIRVYTGSHNNWAENSLSRYSMPAPETEVGVINTSYVTGKIIEIDVTKAIKGDGTYTLILKKDSGGNDVSFRSKEGGFAPELVIN